jgi:hypothetical protein
VSDFVNRMSAQREILRIVNRRRNTSEPLFGLSYHAIERWARSNRIAEDSPLHRLVRDSAEALFVLATKSQEQVTEEYLENSSRVSALIREIGKSVEQEGAVV